MHAARLGYQGVELLGTGRLTLPMPEPERSRVMAIRTGERTFDETIAEIDEVEQRLEPTALERLAPAGSPTARAGSARRFLRRRASTAPDADREARPEVAGPPLLPP